MKKHIKKLITLIIVLFVISFLAFYTTKRRHKEIVENKPRTQIFELDETNVTKYQLNFLEEPIVVQKINGIWKITSPENNYKIDQLEAFANVKNFNTLNIDMIITNLSELSSFGFDNSSNEFTVWDGNKEHKIIVGNRTPDGERYYVKYNDEYFSVEFIYIDALKKTIDMLRDKEIFNNPVSIDSVKTVEIITRDHTNTIQKLNRTNWIVLGVDDKTDIEKAYRDFSTLSLVKASAFVYNQDGIRKEFALPDATVNIYIEDNTKNSYELIYDHINNIVYVKADNDIIYEVDYTVYDVITRALDYYIKTENDDKETEDLEYNEDIN